MGGRAKDEGGPHSAGVTRLALRLRTPEQLRSLFTRELASAAVFVPAVDALPAGQAVELTLQLDFCGEKLRFDGEVVASLPSPIARTGAAPGVAVRLRETPTELRRRLESASHLELGEREPAASPRPRSDPRYPARTPVTLESRGRRFFGETSDVSYNGMLVLVPGVDLADEPELSLRIEHPRSGEALELRGRVANQARCAHGVMAVGVQFLYELDRVDAVARFVDELRTFHHARSLATVSGSLADTPLETVLDTFAGAVPAGTLRLTRGAEEGVIAYREREILHASAGLTSGAKALGRMFSWTDAEFAFQPGIEPIDADQPPLPLESALLAAAVERDEIARLELHRLGADATFAPDEGRLAAIESSLDPLSRSLIENAATGFPLATLLDIMPESDARIFQSLAALVDAGVLRVERG
jgi:Tfp pilus assembly protein PilZ